jgi:hypothetical protein
MLRSNQIFATEPVKPLTVNGSNGAECGQAAYQIAGGKADVPKGSCRF